MNKELEKAIAGTGTDEEILGACTSCQTYTPLSNISIAFGRCQCCEPKKNNRELFNKMVELSKLSGEIK
mgnify:CR=1 FL=1